MDHNPFITRNNDLFIMLMAGMAIQFANSYVVPLSVQHQFLIVLTFSFVAGLFLSSLFQSLEWAVFFALGVMIVALSPALITYGLQDAPDHVALISQLIRSSQYSFFLLSSWLFGIPVGYLVSRSLMGDYYRRGLF